MILLFPWLPILAAVGVMLIPAQQEKAMKSLTIAACLLNFLMVLFCFAQYDTALGGYQFVQSFSWIPAMGIRYQVGLDGINLTLCLLHALVSLAGAFVSTWPKHRMKEYLVFYLLLVGAIYGVFTSLDTFLLYLFYELTLVPLYPMIGIWGSKNKDYGAMKLTLMITGGAVLALLGIMIFYKNLGPQSFDLIHLPALLQSRPMIQGETLMAGLFLVGFGVIASLWPLHSWSPIGYAAAPTSVSMLHAGVLKKMGPYLILRIAVTLLPNGVREWSGILSILAGIGILYAAYAAVKQEDLKFMIGFSSVSHMGYILLAIAAMTPVALSGAVLLMFSHGVMAAATFASIGFLYEQTHKRGVSDFGGLGRQAPFLSLVLIMSSLASLGLPGFSNFVSELLVFFGSWSRFPILVILAIFGVFMTSLYLMRMIQKVCYGPANSAWQNFKDVSGLETKFPFVLLLGALILFGCWPQGLLRLISPAVGAMLS